MKYSKKLNKKTTKKRMSESKNVALPISQAARKSIRVVKSVFFCFKNLLFFNYFVVFFSLKMTFFVVSSLFFCKLIY
jgi:hypothetical protein